MTSLDIRLAMVDVLLVEDNEADVLLAEEAFREAWPACRIHSEEDGESALRYLSRVVHSQDTHIPSLIFLDLNLPSMNGFDVLKAIKNNEITCSIPVVVLSTSRNSSDIHRCYKLHANSYIVKPVDLNSFISIAESVTRYWATTVQLPGREEK